MNPRAGGAEFVTFEIARRLVQRGDSVEWFSASFAGAPAEETLEGVRFVRSGRQWTVHWNAFRRYHGKLSLHFDVVVDQVNTIPFFTPLWSDIPTVMFIHQLAREVWWYESGFPVNALGFICEPLYLRLYRNVPVLTVSASTLDDLKRLGYRAPITIIPEGLEPISQLITARPRAPRFLYVGRLAPSKRVSDIIQAFAVFCRSVEGAELHLLGDGPDTYVRKLHELTHRLGVVSRITFLGRATTREKHREMATAHMLLLASAREGWGLVVTEANAFGTPAICYDVPGLRDSVRHEMTGLLVEPSPKALTEAMFRLWHDRTLYERLSAAAKAWSEEFSFETTSSAFTAAISSVLSDPKQQMAVFDPHRTGDRARKE